MDRKKIELIKKNLLAYKVNAPKEIDIEIDLIEKYDVNIVTIEDKDYPENLRHIYNPPKVLYVKGKFVPEDFYNIAIIGSRMASLYGRQHAERLARELSGFGFTITSGMARGIDTCAHVGALKAGGRTIAVLGCGINIIYPPENESLMARIQRNGAVISEFPIDFPPFRQNFPIRNRIISGLALGVVVVEAAKKSGALITASYALEEGREVFSVPGRVDVPTSKGTLGLIKKGAKLVEDVEDILEELQGRIDIQASGIRHQGSGSAKKIKPTLTDEEGTVYKSLSEEPKHIDEIKEDCSLDLNKLSAILLRLELKNFIKELPGKTFIKV